MKMFEAHERAEGIGENEIKPMYENDYDRTLKWSGDDFSRFTSLLSIFFVLSRVLFLFFSIVLSILKYIHRRQKEQAQERQETRVPSMGLKNEKPLSFFPFSEDNSFFLSTRRSVLFIFSHTKTWTNASR